MQCTVLTLSFLAISLCRFLDSFFSLRVCAAGDNGDFSFLVVVVVTALDVAVVLLAAVLDLRAPARGVVAAADATISISVGSTIFGSDLVPMCPPAIFISVGEVLVEDIRAVSGMGNAVLDRVAPVPNEESPPRNSRTVWGIRGGRKSLLLLLLLLGLWPRIPDRQGDVDRPFTSCAESKSSKRHDEINGIEIIILILLLICIVGWLIVGYGTVL